MGEKTTVGWEKFLTLIEQALAVPGQLGALFSLLFTLEEKETLATRVLLVIELLKGELTHREIAQYLNVSIAKITRGSNALKLVTPELKKFLLESASLI